MKDSSILARITDLEIASRTLDPGPEQRRTLTELVRNHAEEFLKGVNDHAKAYVARDQTLMAGAANPQFPNLGRNPEDALALLADEVEQPGIALTSPNYLGYIPCGGLFHAGLADFLAAVTNRYAALSSASPGAARIENAVCRWMADVLGYPPTASGTLTSGGSIAHLTAIVAAREAMGVDPASAARTVVYATRHAHHCIKKGLMIAGLSNVVYREVPVDQRHRMNVDALGLAIETDRSAGLRPWMVVGTAGNTNTGAVDPLAGIADICDRHDLWFHVDGAYGGLFNLCDEGREVLAGIERSDTVVVDPHKTLFLPYGTGAILARDRQHLYRPFAAEADYMKKGPDDDPEPSPADLSLELTRPFRGLRIWLPLQLAGVGAFKAALSEKILLARYFHQRLSDVEDFQLGPAPDLSIVIYRYIPPGADADVVDDRVNSFNETLGRQIKKDGDIFVTGTKVDGHFFLRAAILSFRTHHKHVDHAIAVITSTAQRLLVNGV